MPVESEEKEEGGDAVIEGIRYSSPPRLFNSPRTMARSHVQTRSRRRASRAAHRDVHTLWGRGDWPALPVRLATDHLATLPCSLDVCFFQTCFRVFMLRFSSVSSGTAAATARFSLLGACPPVHGRPHRLRLSRKMALCLAFFFERICVDGRRLSPDRHTRTRMPMRSG